tara:strand:+ start:238 stop:420 length:183 start_codon:yes stop_codon:yes gene_type:complete
MNLKERGVTIGDLLILVIVLISTFAFLKIKDSKTEQSAKLNNVLIKSPHNIEFDQILNHL